MRVNLKPPTTEERATDPVACHTFADTWRSYPGPGTVEYASRRFPTGTHAMPKTLVFDSPGAVAALDARCQRTWHTAGRRLIALQDAFPAARFGRVIRRITELPEQDFRALTETVAWLLGNPTSGLLLRQIPVEGIGTKWLEQHAVLVLAMLGEATETDLPAAEADETPASSRTRLHQRLGLRTPPELVQVAVLDPDLRTQVGGMRHFAASVDDLNQWQRTPSSVVILENKETGYAFTEDNPDTVVLHGQGFNVLNYAKITWVRAAKTIIYWGDIDGPGLEFVADLRALGVPATTVLMDEQTLNAFRHLSVTGAAPRRPNPGALTDAELNLYKHLRAHSVKHGTGLLLEQERIPWGLAHDQVMSVLCADAVTRES
jgi:hypothetical protein